MPAVRFEKRFYIKGRFFGPGVEDVPAELLKQLPKSAKELKPEQAKKAAEDKAAREAAEKDQEIALSQLGKAKGKPKSFFAAMARAAEQQQ
jgi:hypothetical protein